jgi:DNA invertase Pin-like site-specific DNA recombinase
MKAALYLRVSTSQQTTSNQRRELESYCERQGWQVAEIYDDSGVSGSKQERPALDRMLKDATAGKFQVVVVWKIDRLARSVAHLLSILQQLQSAGVGFCSTTQQLDTTTPYGRMVTQLLGCIAEFERSLVVERVKIGMASARARGSKIGRPRTAVDIRKALELRMKGLGLKQIARLIGVPRSTLHRTLQAIPKPCTA